MPDTTPWTCPSCRLTVATPFCAQCGEEPLVPADLTLRGLAAKLLHAFTSIDARAARRPDAEMGAVRGEFGPDGQAAGEWLSHDQDLRKPRARAGAYPGCMKLLVTNDDGIDAAGIAALEYAAQGVGERVVVAPAGPQSGVSHAVTTGQVVALEAIGMQRYRLHGTPADCTRLGLLHVVPDAAFVLSGINHGGNLGADVYYSGTVAAVREAVLPYLVKFARAAYPHVETHLAEGDAGTLTYQGTRYHGFDRRG